VDRYRVVTTTSSCDGLRRRVGGPEVRDGDTIECADTIGSGKFGVVAGVTVVGRPGRPAVLKRLFAPADGALTGLRVVADLHRALNRLPDLEWAAHGFGVPYWAGEVEAADGTRGVGLLGVDLRDLGYVSLEDVIEARGASLFDLSLDDRSQLAASFAEGQALLERIRFLHADINPPNVFVNLPARAAAFIDVDGGALQQSGHERPTAAGKIDDFLAPELGGPGPGSVCRASEQWSVGVGVGYLLLGAHPLFFLRNLGRNVVREYLDNFHWPEIDQASDLFSDQRSDAYGPWLEEVRQLPGETRELFQRMLAGYDDPVLRPSAWDWAMALQGGPPWFERVTVVTPVVLGRTTTVAWWAPRAASVSVDDLTGLPPRGAVEIEVRRTGPLSLVASNLFGTCRMESDVVTVVTFPAPAGLAVPVPVPVVSPSLVRQPKPSVPVSSVPKPELRLARSARAVRQDIGDRRARRTT
jgi:hypothetical protein